MIAPRFYFQGEFTEFRDLILKYGGIRKNIPKSTMLFKANVLPNRRSYYIEKGIAKHCTITEDGNEIINYFFGAGSIFPFNCFDELLTIEDYTFLVSVTPLEVIEFASMDVVPMAAEEPRMIAAIINHYSCTLNTMLTKALLNSTNNPLQLLASFIYLHYEQRVDANNELMLTQEDIGKIMGYSRAHVARTIGMLKKEGIIDTSRGKIKVLDMDRLKAICMPIV